MCSSLNGECLYTKQACVVLRYLASKEAKEAKTICHFAKRKNEGCSLATSLHCCW